MIKVIQLKWRQLWHGDSPGFILMLINSMTGFLTVIPIFYVIIQAIQAGLSRWQRLLDNRIPDLLGKTLSLMVAVTIIAVVLGVSLAFLLVRTDLPFKKLLSWLVAIPLVIPPYVGAVAYILVLGPSGFIKQIWDHLSGNQGSLSTYPINIFSFLGVAFVLAMFTYPYVYLLTVSALKKMNRNFEEAAASMGMGAGRTFLKVTLPLLRPAIGSGAILVALYVLSDFGAVSMMRYVTFTAAIYFQRVGFDMSSASVLSLVLVLLTLLLLTFDSATKRSKHYVQTGNSFRRPNVMALGRWKALALFYVILIVLIGVIIPVVILIRWSIVGIVNGALDQRFFRFAWNSMSVSSIAALVCMVLAMPIVYMKLRYPSIISRTLDRMAYTGYALPGMIIGLGFVALFNQYVPWLYGTVVVIVLAFVVRFLPQALQAGEAALTQIGPQMDEASRSLGYSPMKTLFKVILPNMLPGILSGGALVFVSAMKELPITLMLRPPGFDTLAVRVYFEAQEAVYYLAAPGALIMILISILPLNYMINKY
ncbi:MAG: iron ABC transporter permease [Firmicutes bacterium HGW-Firmicutes-2]|nr:MAG: iron ABC transporter permease [Firmicutes bacterium HGW-Firmicutes-2]